jgi:hypothetical protein
VSEDLREIVDNYCRTWDVDAPEGLIEEVYAPDVVDHNPQPGQTAGIEGVKMIMVSTTLSSLTCTSVTTT